MKAQPDSTPAQITPERSESGAAVFGCDGVKHRLLRLP